MNIVNFSVRIEDSVDGEQVLKKLEKAGRTCYKSSSKISDDSYLSFIKRIIINGHESVLEHEKVTVRVVCDRGVSHEVVRHRIGSYSQESTRYCNYSKNKFGNEITYIFPTFWELDDEKFEVWKKTMITIEDAYFKLIKMGATPQEARSVLPNSLKTEIVITYNLREWRHFFKVRTSKNAHPQMREVALTILSKFLKLIPIVFDDILGNY
ncbi:FAD-dependent thymidylate synthase [Mycoplasmatota bacterium zrk1]